MDQTLQQIARTALDIETLETQRADRLDFHDVAVWRLKAALEAAYRAGASRRPWKPPTGLASKRQPRVGHERL